MPLLDDDDLNRLRRMRPIGICADCRAILRQNYCRTHDEYFVDGHDAFCAGLLDWAHDEQAFHLKCPTYGKELGIRAA